MTLKPPYRVRNGALRGVAIVAVFVGCSGADDKFAAESFDEYTEPLTNAVIGSPEGVVRIGGAADAPLAAEGISVDGGAAGGPVSGGTGGSSIAGSGGSGTGGSSIAGSGGSGTGGSSIAGSGGSAIGGSGGSGIAGAAGSAIGAGGSISDGGFAGRGGASADGGLGAGASGFWHFDDCSPTSNFLQDSSGLNANAQHALGGSCVAGISGQAVEIRTAKDVVQVPDEPQFTVSQQVAVGAWVRPNTVTGNQPIVIKRLKNETAFSLGIHNGNIEISVVLTSGTTVISRAPIQPGVWSHVAGMFDGTFLFLFVNGQQFGQVFAAGAVRNVFAPIRIGATTQAQHFDGIIDDVFLSSAPISKDQLTVLSCIQRPATLAVTPASSGPVAAGTSVNYQIAVSNNDAGFCPPSNVQASFNFDPQFNINANIKGQQVRPGETFTFATTVTSSEDVDPGVHDLPFLVGRFSTQGPFRSEVLRGQLTYEVATPTGCFVVPSRELMIKHLSVVDDPVRTSGNGTLGGGGGSGGSAGDGGSGGSAGNGGLPPPRDAGLPVRDGGSLRDAGSNALALALAPESSRGAWSFGHLMRELAPTPEQAAAMTEQMLRSFLTEQTVNGFKVEARPAMQPIVLDGWPRMPDGSLDLDHAPITLEAIVNRVDVRDLSQGSGGEGRFVFGVNSSAGFPLEFTFIFEFNLPARTQQDVIEWANLWHDLSSHPFPSEEYNAALERVTRRFTDRNASPGSVNGSALTSFRSNELALSSNGRWQLRQFDLSPETGFFRLVPLLETPDLSFNNSKAFADFVNQNAAAIIAEVPGGLSVVMPPKFGGANFQAGSIFNDLVNWSGPGIVSSEARFHASMNTCNGCHGPETNSGFLQITPRGIGAEATLSPFITGTTVFDRFTGEARTLNDLKRRKDDLTHLVCPADADAGAFDAGPPVQPQDAGPTAPPVDATPPVEQQDAMVPIESQDAAVAVPDPGATVELPDPPPASEPPPVAAVVNPIL
jgi:hypothetical protein